MSEPCNCASLGGVTVSAFLHGGRARLVGGGADAFQADINVSARTFCQGAMGHNQMDCSPVDWTPVTLSGKHRNILSSPAKPCQVSVFVIASRVPQGSHPYFFIVEMYTICFHLISIEPCLRPDIFLCNESFEQSTSAPLTSFFHILLQLKWTWLSGINTGVLC